MDRVQNNGWARITRTLRDLDQALIGFCGPWDGSLRTRFGSVKAWRLIALFLISFLGCIVLNRIQGRAIMSGETLLVFGWLAVSIYYSLRTPAKGRPGSNAL